jgi:tellurite resistance protein TerC
VLSALAFDLRLLTRSRRQRHELSIRAATARSVGWAALSLLFGVGVLIMFGKPAALTFVTAYLLEQSLSIDNVFVFVLIFSELKIPPALQRSVLLWGVLGALVMRGLLIAAGLFLLNEFHWVVYPFAALIIVAAVRLLWGKQKEQNLVVAACSICNTWVARFIPITPQYHGGRFVVRQERARESARCHSTSCGADHRRDHRYRLRTRFRSRGARGHSGAVLVYTSNVFAMLGLRSLYFVLAGVVERFRFLRVGLASILIFFGARLLLGDVLEVPTAVSLGVIAAALTLSIAVSIRWPGASTSSAATPSLRP